MKFKIEEKRGKFRIMKWKEWDREEPSAWYPIGKPYKLVKDEGWAALLLKECWSVEKYHQSPDWEVMKFDSYKEAEKYIKRNFGLDGVKNIVEPDWRTV